MVSVNLLVTALGVGVAGVAGAGVVVAVAAGVVVVVEAGRGVEVELEEGMFVDTHNSEGLPAKHRHASVDRHEVVRVVVLHKLPSAAKHHARMLHLSSAPPLAAHTLVAQ